MIAVEQVVAAIYQVEGGSHTHHPYGIKSVRTSNPRRVCENTVRHALHDYKPHRVDRGFVYYLADRYCPSSSDKQGNLNWKVNMVRILKLK
jgi:hypothetical protein